MSFNDTIRLLIINDTQSEVERLLSMLQNAGKNTRAQHVPSEEGLEKLLNDSAWDLLIGLDGSDSIDPKQAIRTIKKLDKDVPVIIQADVEDDAERSIALIEGLKAGARDVVVLDDDQHLLMVMDRELDNLVERRDRRSTDRKFNSSERRCQQLLDSSRDGIAYIEDGMFLYTNLSFAQLFGFEDPDDALVTPLVDMIAEGSQDEYVQFMKSMKMSDSAGSQELAVKGVKEDGSEFDLSMAVSHAVYDDENCMQVVIEGAGATIVVSGDASAAAAAPAATGGGNKDDVTGLYNRRYMLDAVGNAVTDAAENDKYRSLFYLSVDRFSAVRSDLGLNNTDAMLKDLADLLLGCADDTDTLASMGEEEFLLLTPGIDSEKSMEKASEICKKVEAHVCNAGDKSVQVTVSIGIAPISESATNPDDIISRAHQAADEARAEGTDGVGNRAKVYIPKISGDSEDHSNILEVVRHKLEKNEFKLLFQPVVSLQGVEEEHYEIYLGANPNEDEEEPIGTGTIFKAVESDPKLAVKLDRWILTTAFKKLSEHRAAGHNTRLMVNLTSASLQDESLAEWLGVAFKASDVPANAVVFQVSENDATNYLKNAKSFFDNIKAQGSFCTIKQFGCSLDPFKTLQHYPMVDFVKVDGSFSTDIQSNNESPDALKEIISKLSEASKQAIVPYVENATMMATLWQAGAHFIQGNYLQPPAEVMEFEFDEE
jgi:diguanylate cyclase (GGDEF)-like protein/PAS domain S-box-containing protein